MTPQEQADKINALIANWSTTVSETFTLAITKLETDITNRIFNKHENANGGKLGQYSTTPTLIGAKSFATKTSANAFFSSIKKKDKKEPSKWRTLKNGKHAYILDGGYKELKSIQGLYSSEINMQYRGELAESGIGTVINGESYMVKFLNKLSENKGRGFEKRRNEVVFSASEQEKQDTFVFIGTALINEIKQAFGNV